MQDIFYGTTGPRSGAKIAFVLESWGDHEASTQSSLSGPTGRYVNHFLEKIVKIPRAACFVTNVVMEQPAQNEMPRFFYRKGETAEPPYKGLQPHPNVRTGLSNLAKQLSIVKPELVIACGNYAAWALTDDCFDIKTSPTFKGIQVPTGIDDWRGSQTYTSQEMGHHKCLLVYHPSNCLYKNYTKFLFEHDIAKRVPLAFKPGAWEPHPEQNLIIGPSFDEARDYLQTILLAADRQEVWLSCDIETLSGGISCIGFSASIKHAICIPFILGYNRRYFSEPEEIQIRLLIRRIFYHPNIKLIGQNFRYDAEFLEQDCLSYNRLADHDTLSVQHLLYPGLPKDLGHLASLYCSFYRYWKEDKDTKIWNPKKIRPEDHWLYNARDSLNTFEIAMRQRQVLLRDPVLSNLYETKRKRMVYHAYVVSKRGVHIDQSIIKSQLDALEAAAQSRIDFLNSVIPNSEYFDDKTAPWWHSTDKQKKIFYRCLGLPPIRLKRGKRGPETETFGWKAILQLMDQHPWLTCIFKPLAELGSIDAAKEILTLASSVDRLYTSYDADGTETFRFASKVPNIRPGTNLQNITSGTEG